MDRSPWSTFAGDLCRLNRSCAVSPMNEFGIGRNASPAAEKWAGCGAGMFETEQSQKKNACIWQSQLVAGGSHLFCLTTEHSPTLAVHFRRCALLFLPVPSISPVPILFCFQSLSSLLSRTCGSAEVECSGKRRTLLCTAKRLCRAESKKKVIIGHVHSHCERDEQNSAMPEDSVVFESR